MSNEKCSAFNTTALLADVEYDKAMASFKMVDGLPMDHDDYLRELDGELVVDHDDGTFDYVS